MNYSDLINRTCTDVDLNGVHLLNSYIQSILFRYTGKNVSGFIVLKDANYETISSFFEFNEISIPKNMKKILESIGKNQIGIDLKVVNDCVIFGFFERHKNIDFYSNDYKQKLPKSMMEDAIRVTYDLKKDEPTYLKFYCRSNLDPKNKSSTRYYNFGYLIDKERKLLLNCKQVCIHKKPKKDNEIPDRMMKDYKTVKGLGFDVYQFATRENSNQSYLYIKKSL